MGCILLIVTLKLFLFDSFTLTNQLDFNQTSKDGIRFLSCDVITQNGAKFALKLLKSIPYDPTTNQMFFPMALKLSLLSFASVSADEKQTQTIYGFIFDDVEFDHEPNVQEGQSKTNEEQILKQLNRSVETTTQHYPFEREQFYKRYNWEYRGNYEGIARRQNKRERDEGLCVSFHESYQNWTAISDCLSYVQSNDNDNSQLQTGKLELNSRQKMQLCRTFGIESYLDCIHLLNKSSSASRKRFATHSSTDQTVNRKCISSQAWQLARVFNAVPCNFERERKYGLFSNYELQRSTINNFIYQFLFVNDGGDLSKNEQDKIGWNKHFDWYGLRQFDSHNLTQIDEWILFKRNNLSGLLLPELVNIPASSDRAELLNVIMIDKRMQNKFVLEKRTFYGPKFNKSTKFVDQKQIFQIETLVTEIEKFSIEHHIDRGWNHSLLRLAYHDHRYSLVLAMPDPNATIPDLLAGLNSDQLHHYLQLLNTSTKVITYLAVPSLRLGGKMNFGSVLREALNMSSLNLSLPSSSGAHFSIALDSVQQLIRVTNFGADETLETSFSTLDVYEHKDPLEYIRFNRPFVYMLIGKYIELQTRQPSFEVLITGFYNGPEQMLAV